MSKKQIILISSALSIFALISGAIFAFYSESKQIISPQAENTQTAIIEPTTSLTPTSTPTPSPTPQPLTFVERNKLYGPCTNLPTLMYHHIQDAAVAKQEGHPYLAVNPDIFRQQMQYLHNHGYSVLDIQNLVNFFNSNTSLPKKSVLLTFDDGYDDFYNDAYPILKEFGYPSVLFVPTGLIENPGYLTWSHIKELAQNSVFIANHTWSHRNMASSKEIIEKEIGTAEKQLGERGYDAPKIFAYPYGLSNANSEQYLQKQGFELAFTTKAGSTLCKQQRFELPRIRVGNAPLNSYGI